MGETRQVVVLAAGQGTRMRSTLPKVLHRLGGMPLIDHVLRQAAAISGEPPVVIVSPRQGDVSRHLAGRAEVSLQMLPVGSGDAVRATPPARRTPGTVVVLSGDVPLLSAETLRRLVEHHEAVQPAATVLVARPQSTAPLRGLGRVIRSGQGIRVIEERDLAGCESEERNAGIYCFSGAALWPAIERLTPENAQGEYYLTQVFDLIEGPVEVVTVDDATEILGVNDRSQLAEAEAALRHRTLTRLMAGGVTVVDPVTTYVDATVEVGQDSVIHPLSVLRGDTRLGRDCQIGPGALLDGVTAGDRVTIGQSVVEQARLGDDVTIGHFNRVRPASTLEAGVSLGTHAEVKNSTVGPGSRINHFSCVLDSRVGSGVNIGAGTITCNFDGHGKHGTTIGNDVFIGSHATLVAPVTVEDGAYIAAGSVITGTVPAGALGVGRARQRNIEGWAARRSRHQETRS